MADKYISAEAFKLKTQVEMTEEKAMKPTDTGFHNFLDAIYSLIVRGVDDMPAADVVEVVRCKDCKHCEEVDVGLWYCNSEDFKVVGSYTEADFYCGAGLRKHRKEKEDGANNT